MGHASSWLSFLMLMVVGVYAQEKATLSIAKKYLEMKNIEMAKNVLETILKKEGPSPDVLYYLGYCYVNWEYDKTKAINTLLDYFEIAKNIDNNAYYLLGRAYHLNYQFDSAIIYYRKFILNGGGRVATKQKVELDIQQCMNGKELMKYPVKVKIENMGPEINTPYPEYFPFVDADESFMLFNSRREDGSILLPDGYYAANVYCSIVKDGKFTNAKPLGQEINTPENNEEIVGMSPNGRYVIIYTDYKTGYGDLLLSVIQDKSDVRIKYSIPVPLPPPINSPYSEMAATINDDGTMIVFASDRPGGYGEQDLYIAKKLPNGEWGKPYNMGSTINTPYNEDFPNFAPDNKTLFFSSEGHISMGGLDIFKSEYDVNTGKSSIPKSLGYPINTVFDDMNFRISKTGRYGYMSTIRKEGYGNYDIYRITFLEVEPLYTVVRGRIFTRDTTRSIKDVIITAVNGEGELVGYYQPNPISMRYVMILPPGKYDITVESDGFRRENFYIEIMDKTGYLPEIIKDIEMVSK